MTVASDVNFEELARSTDEFNGAQLKAVCVEAGMIALREGATKLSHEHFLSGIAEGEQYFSVCRQNADKLLINSAEQEEEPAQLLHVGLRLVFGLCNVVCFSCHIRIVDVFVCRPPGFFGCYMRDAACLTPWSRLELRLETAYVRWQVYWVQEHLL